MGFYGKVNHTDKVSFTIDKVYESRYDMEQALLKGVDTVFIGRYVLVNYEGNDIEKNYLRLFAKENENYLYFSSDLDEASRATSNEGDFHIDLNQIVYTLDEQQRQTYYICTSYTNGFAIFKKLSESPEGSNKYYSNYQKDYNEYGPGRGYDSTVWQKIYVDGAEKYAMVAELNSVVPTFTLVSDAPTIEPVAPHFDSDSTNVYYRLHMQPQWGMRVKKANGSDSSDTTITKSDEEIIDSEGNLYDGSIYYNKDGFTKEIKTYDSTGINKISITPSGFSGKLYNSHNDNNPSETTKQIDTQEIQILLPSLGNAISDVWDIIYGYETNGTRTTNLGWDQNGTKRLVKEDETGYLFNEGDDIATVAGCINSVHDLMGKIIDNKKDKESTITPSSASIDKIYYGDFRENKDGKPEYNFYIKDTCYEYEDATEPSVVEIPNMTQFEKNKYYYTSDNNYYLETNDYTYGKNYFNIDTTEISNLIDSYEPGKYYYLYENNYLLENNSDPDETKIYYTINPDATVPITNPAENKIFFQGRDQIIEDGINKGYCYLDDLNVYRPLNKNSIFNSNYSYYWAEGYEMKRVPSQDEPDNPEKDNLSLIIDEEKDIKYEVFFVEFDETKSYYHIDENNNYIKLLKENIDDSLSYFIFTNDAITPVEGLFYEPNTYHYSTNGIDYIFGIEKNKVENVPYYKLDSEQMKVTFYQPNKYYYWDGNDYVIDMNLTKGEHDYVIYQPLYVIPEKSNSDIFTDGSVWNPNLPSDEQSQKNYGVVLGTRKESWRWKKLNGFARNLNTIHGLIVKINNILKVDDVETRDRATVQGCINAMNDIMNRIDVLKPNHFIAVNEYGRMTSMTSAGDSWIDISIDKDKNNTVTINHIGPVAKDARNEDNKEPLFGETFEIEDWVFDEKGHKANISKHTIKIPQGSLTAAASNESDVVTQLEFTPSTGEIKTIREDIANLKLNSYVKNDENSDVVNTDTLGEALSKLQTQIIEEEIARSSAASNTMNDLNEAINKEAANRDAAILVETNNRIAAINALDATITTESAEVITSITQTDGLVDADKKKVGELTLTGWTLGESVASSESIADTDTVNNAFAKAQRQINANAANLANLSTTVSNANDKIEDLELVVSTEKIAQWNAAEANVQSDWAESDETADSYIKNKPTLNFVPMETYNALLERIAALEARIEALENPGA